MAEKIRRTGQIIKRGENSWLIRIYLGEDDKGNRKYHNKTIHGSKKDAQKYLNKSSHDKDFGRFIEPIRQTLNQYLDQWLNVIKPRVAERTFNSYRMMLNTHIRSKIGDLKLSDIKVLTVQKVYSEMSLHGLSPRTVRYTHAVFSMAMNKAVEWGIIVNNPCNLAELPRQDRKERKAFSPKQALLFLKAAVNNRFGLVFEFALSSGACDPENTLRLNGVILIFSNTQLQFSEHSFNINLVLVDLESRKQQNPDGQYRCPNH